MFTDRELLALSVGMEIQQRRKATTMQLIDEVPQEWKKFGKHFSMYQHVSILGDSLQVLFKCPRGYEVSIICNKISFGHAAGLFELAMFKNDHFTKLERFLPESFVKRVSSDGQLLGWLTVDEVTEILNKVVEELV